MKKSRLFLIIVASALLAVGLTKTNSPVAHRSTQQLAGCSLTFNVTTEGWQRVNGVLISNVFGYVSVPYGATGQYSLTSDSTVFVSVGIGNCYDFSFPWGQYTWTYCGDGSSGGVLFLPKNREVEQYSAICQCACPFQGTGLLYDNGNGTVCQK